jgi:hypothetical protein
LITPRERKIGALAEEWAYDCLTAQPYLRVARHQLFDFHVVIELVGGRKLWIDAIGADANDHYWSISMRRLVRRKQHLEEHGGEAIYLFVDVTDGVGDIGQRGLHVNSRAFHEAVDIWDLEVGNKIERRVRGFDDPWGVIEKGTLSPPNVFGLCEGSYLWQA